MACDIDDREGKSPSPMEPGLGRMFHSSATGRRREQTLPEALGLRQALHHEMTLREVLVVRRGPPGALQPTKLRSRAQPGRATRIGYLTAYAATGGRPRTRSHSRSSGAPNSRTAGAQNDGLSSLPWRRILGVIRVILSRACVAPALVIMARPRRRVLRRRFRRGGRRTGAAVQAGCGTFLRYSPPDPQQSRDVAVLKVGVLRERWDAALPGMTPLPWLLSPARRRTVPARSSPSAPLAHPRFPG